MNIKTLLSLVFFISLNFALKAQELIPEIKGDSIIYNLTIDYKSVNLTGKDVTAMTINNSIPGPALRFKEGKHAVIKVTNKMSVETSIHWHGLLLSLIHIYYIYEDYISIHQKYGLPSLY